jgi:hypothetical protein
LRPMIQSNISNLLFFPPNSNFSNPFCAPPSSPWRLRKFLVACRSQDNPKCTVPDEVPPRAANRRPPYPSRLDRPDKWFDWPMSGTSTSRFLMTACSSALVCSTEKISTPPHQVGGGLMLQLQSRTSTNMFSSSNVHMIHTNIYPNSSLNLHCMIDYSFRLIVFFGLFHFFWPESHNCLVPRGRIHKIV